LPLIIKPGQLMLYKVIIADCSEILKQTCKCAAVKIVEFLQFHLSKTCFLIREHSLGNPPRNSFLLFREKGNLLHFKACCIVSGLFSTKCLYWQLYLFLFK
jgi:hypothetical protein